MKQIPLSVAEFLDAQGFVIVSSLDVQGFPHSSCKDIVKIDSQGIIYLLDVYHGVTGENIARNPKISISAVDEHKFMGYCLKGRARVMSDDHLSQELLKSWESNLTSRLTKRLLKNLTAEQGQGHHPEASFPKPKHLISLQVEEIVDLAQYHSRKGGTHG